MAKGENTIQLAHGGGGELTAELIEQVILPALGAGGGQTASQLKDAATLDYSGGRLAFTTDSYVVQPLEFPGADIGKLAICGTVNDLAVVGARPLALSLAVVLEEGLEIDLLRRVLETAGRTAAAAGVTIVTGDTKVVEYGSLKQMIINTAGIGQVSPQAQLGFDRLADGDRILLSGPLGEHGLAVMSKREGLSFQSELRSDCAAIEPLARMLVDEGGPAVRFMRDPTRGGLAATLVELSAACGRNVEIIQGDLPLNRTALAAAEMLGLDLLTVANEGKLVAVVAEEFAARAVALLRGHPLGAQAAQIGRVGASDASPLVEMITLAGGRRIVQMPYGEELPRIC